MSWDEYLESFKGNSVKKEQYVDTEAILAGAKVSHDHAIEIINGIIERLIGERDRLQTASDSIEKHFSKAPVLSEEEIDEILSNLGRS